MRRSKIGLGREMKELGPALGGHWHIIFSKRKAENFPPQVTSRTWRTRLHARTSVRLRIPILPGRNFAHWTRSSNSLASTAICFFFLAPKGVWPSFQWGDRHDFLFFLLSFLFGFFAFARARFLPRVRSSRCGLSFFGHSLKVGTCWNLKICNEKVDERHGKGRATALSHRDFLRQRNPETEYPRAAVIPV